MRRDPLLYQYLILALILVCTLTPSMVVAAVTRNSVSTWYKDLKKPAWNPPGWVFGPVWTTLYVAMSVAVWMIWKEEPTALWAFRLYALQLLLNHAWSPVFFLLKKPGLAFRLIVLLWLAIMVTTVVFFYHLPAAGKLMLPYLAWVTFASYLNFRIWQDNQVPLEG